MNQNEQPICIAGNTHVTVVVVGRLHAGRASTNGHFDAHHIADEYGRSAYGHSHHYPASDSHDNTHTHCYGYTTAHTGRSGANGHAH
jgi:hypothetical protein